MRLVRLILLMCMVMGLSIFSCPILAEEERAAEENLETIERVQENIEEAREKIKEAQEKIEGAQKALEELKKLKASVAERDDQTKMDERINKGY